MQQKPTHFGMWFIFRRLGFLNVIKLAGQNLFSIHHYYVLKLNLKRMHPYPVPVAPKGTLTSMQPEDLDRIAKDLKGLGRQDRREILSRMNFYQKGFRDCYGIRVNGDIACMQWLIESKDNPVIRKSYRRTFYPLHEKQAMLDNVFTFPKYRGRGYMTLISRNLLKLASDRGNATVITYIQKDKISPLNEFFDMGFKITGLLREIKILGHTFRNL